MDDSTAECRFVVRVYNREEMEFKPVGWFRTLEEACEFLRLMNYTPLSFQIEHFRNP